MIFILLSLKSIIDLPSIDTDALGLKECPKVMGGFGPVARFKYLSAFAAGDLFSLSSEFDSHCLFGFWPSRFATEERNHLLHSGIVAGGR